MSLLLHTHKNKEHLLQGLDLEGTWAPLRWPLTELSSLRVACREPTARALKKPHGLTHCLNICIVLHQRGTGRERGVNGRKGSAWSLTSQVLREGDFEHFMTSDETNVLFIYFIVLHRVRTFFCLSVFCKTSEQNRDYLSNS